MSAPSRGTRTPGCRLAKRGGFAVRARNYALAWLAGHPDDTEMRRALAGLGPDSIAH